MKNINQSSNSPQEEQTEIILFVAPDEPNSLVTEKSVRVFFEKSFKSSGSLKIINVFDDYNTAIEHNIVVVPTLIIKSPTSEKRIIGAIESESLLSAILRRENEEKENTGR